MRTKDELFREAQRHIAGRRQQAVTRAERMRAAAFAAHPELAAAEETRVQAGLALTLAAARGADTAPAAKKLEEAGQALEEALRKAGRSPADLEPRFSCPLCHDTGLYKGVPCQCVAQVARTLRREEINAASPLALCGFDTFDVTRYPAEVEPELGGPPREYMTKVLQFCRRWTESFGQQSPNLLFMGGAGLGKTHLALAVADAVLEKGYDVLYTSSAALAAQLSREHFDRDSEDSWLSACKEADLLILDDLGTEHITALTISVLYELVNTRMLCHRPTVYTTNITDQGIFEARYTEKVSSRMLGNCRIFKFFGVDQRLNRAK